MIEVPRPVCNAVTLPTSAEQIVFHDRKIAHHDGIVTLRTLVWRS